MKTLISLVICIMSLPASTLAVTAEGDAGRADTHPPSAAQGSIKPQEDREILQLLEQDPTQALSKMDKERLLPALAYALRHRYYRLEALSFARMHLPDPRLAPHVAQAMQRVSYGQLVDAIMLVKTMPDRLFLPALMEHALPVAHWYLERHPEADAPGRGSYLRVFAHTAELLHVITKGEVGVEKLDPEKLSDEQRRKLYADWRAWWKKNKAAWLVPGALPDRRQVEPKKDEEVLRLLREFADPKKPWEKKKEAMDTLAGLDQERLLLGLAYALDQGEYRRPALSFLRTGRLDGTSRLVPFVARCMAQDSDEQLGQTILTAKQMPDPQFLPPIMEQALSSTYMSHSMAAPPGEGAEHHWNSVFAEAAELLFLVTKGEIGLESVRRDIPFPWQEQEKLTKQWRDWWERNKAEWVPNN